MFSSFEFIEFTRHISPRQGYKEEPRFNTKIWPLLLRHADAIEKIYLFVNSRWSGSKKSFEAGERVSANIADIGPLAWFSSKQFKEIESRSSTSGHLNALYQIAATDSLLSQFFHLWTIPAKLYQGQMDDLGLKRDETLELAQFIESINDSKIIAGFGHETEPLYVFGSSNTLQNLFYQANNRDVEIYSQY